jgi:hypothetical protein
MAFSNRRIKFYIGSFIRHDFKASVTVFLLLCLCLGISLASVRLFIWFAGGHYWGSLLPDQ